MTKGVVPVQLSTRSSLTPGYGGWVRYQERELPLPVFVRFAEENGRLQPVEMYLAVEGSLDANLLRRVPLGRIEAAVNSQGIAERVREGLRLPGPDLRRAISYFSTALGSQWARDPEWPLRMLAAQYPDSGERQPKMRPLASPLKEETFEIDATIAVPKSRADYGDDFYRRVAEVYGLIARYSRAPAADLARANGVPVTTVHRWVKEARRRGYLPAGHAGKAG